MSNRDREPRPSALAHAHGDLQDLTAATDFGTLLLDSDLRIKRFTDPVMDIFTIAPGDGERPIAEVAHQLEQTNLVEDAQAVLAGNSSVNREARTRDGRWYDVRLRPYCPNGGAVDGVIVTLIDVTERHQAETALRERERQLQRQKSLIDLSHDPIFVWDFDGGIVEWNRGCEDLYGYSADEAVGRRKMELLRTVVPGGSVETLKEELLRNGSWSGELKHQAKDGHIVTVESRLQLESMDGQRLVLESTRDVTERKVWEQRQHLLLRELTHRVKNTLAVVQSIANQTLRHTRSREDFVERFSARLAALAAAHGLLVHSDWKDADFEALARAQLDPYTPEHPGRLYLEGPQTGLPADLATPFGLVLHELAANAAKYGALSRDEGRVDLRWTIEPRGDERVFRLVWREVNGPPRKRGFKAGFGSMLIDKGVPGATVRREFTGDGFVCTIDLVLRKGRPPDTET
jgi:two-component system CheB/CheR fusion protein